MPAPSRRPIEGLPRLQIKRRSYRLVVSRHASEAKPVCLLGSTRGRKVHRMSTFVLRLIAPRSNFAQTLTESEREIMNRHAAHWRPYLERGDIVAFGPVLTEDDSYGLAVVETDDEQALREFAAQDPVVTTGTAVFELGRMAAGHVRGREHSDEAEKVRDGGRAQA